MCFQISTDQTVEHPINQLRSDPPDSGGPGGRAWTAHAGYQTRLRKFVSETGCPPSAVNTMASRPRPSMGTDMPSRVRGGTGRDGWRCHACGEPVPQRWAADQLRLGPALAFATPWTQGGRYDKANARLAHFGCVMFADPAFRQRLGQLLVRDLTVNARVGWRGLRPLPGPPIVRPRPVGLNYQGRGYRSQPGNRIRRFPQGYARSSNERTLGWLA